MAWSATVRGALTPTGVVCMLKFAMSMVVASVALTGIAVGQGEVQDEGETRGGILSGFGGDTNIFGFEADPIERPFEPDRPRFRSSVGVVPVGRFSLQAGVNFSFDDESGTEVKTLSGPDMLLRTGIAERVEGRVGWGGYQEVDVTATGFNDTTSGVTDMFLGVKVDVISNNTGAVPAVVVVVEASLPTGADEFTSDRVDPSAEIAFDYNEIDDVFGFSGAVQVTQLENMTTDDTYLQTSASLSFDQEWNDEVETFVEYFAFFNDDDDIEDSHFVQTGAVLTIVPNVTLDAKVGVGLTTESSDFFAGAGATVSF
jgi:hypothetical protein